MHGNTTNIGQGLPLWAGLYQKLRVNLLLLEYRGYGESEGEPSEEGLLMDAIAALEYLNETELIDRKQIFVFGLSLGGAVATALCAKPAAAPHIRGLILENTFLSVSSMASRVFLPLRFIPESILRHFMRSRWMTCEAILRVKVPILMLCGKYDNLVGHDQMKSLFKLARQRKGIARRRIDEDEKIGTNSAALSMLSQGSTTDESEWMTLFDAGHADLFLKHPSKYFGAIGKFLNRV
mmetsp:Transcript_33666/g.81546  ORF Transcript_33666/g.81546 Transcript_33666/m.81546 type:complete len:237 (+) Transcript_33666:71-781(+)